MARCKTLHRASDLAGFCEHGNVLSGPIKSEKFIRHLKLIVSEHKALFMELCTPFECWPTYRLKIPGQYLETRTTCFQILIV
jgi:hypothetical protein